MKWPRALVLASLVLVILGLRPAAPTAAQAGLSVVATTGTYPGAPRSVAVLDATLPSGQHLWFDRDLCRTFAWLDTDNTTTLANPIAIGARWPMPDVLVYEAFPTPYSDPNGGLWASDWGTAAQPHFQGYTVTADSVTFTCDHQSTAGPRYTVATTYTHVVAPTGTGYTFAAAITPTSGRVQGGGAQQTGLGAVGGDGSQLSAWDFNGDGSGVRQLPWAGMPSEYDTAFWVILTHPQGHFVLAQPNLHDTTAISGWFLRNAFTGFLASRYLQGSFSGSTWHTDPLRFTWTRSTRSVPQKYLDARYGLLAEWQQHLGLGPQHLPPVRAGQIDGEADFAAMAVPSSWQGTGVGLVDWGLRDLTMIAQVPMYHTTNGAASGIDGSAGNLAPDLYLPNASDLPGIVAAPNGQTYSYGTLAQFRDGLNLMRLLGLRGTYWSQWEYRSNAARQLPELSHFDTSWPSSYLLAQHPEFLSGCPNACQIDYTKPGVFAWMQDWSQQYWLDYGMQGKFMDSSPQIWDVFGSDAPQFIDFAAWYMRHNGYIKGETPQSFYGPLYYNAGSTYQLWGREWGAPFADTGPRWRNCLGVEGAAVDICNASNAGKYDLGVHYDVPSARRMNSVGAGYGIGGQDWMFNEYAYDTIAPGHTGAVKAELHRAGAFQDQHGPPDRIELVNPTVPATNPWPVVLGAALNATATTVWVNPIYQLPLAGVLVVDGEHIRYAGQDSDVGLNMGVSTLQNVQRGADGTTAAAHSAGATVAPLNDQMHWTFDDAYWIYGQGANEVWIKYSDGSVWQPGGTLAGALPSITDVAVTAGTGGTTVTWQTTPSTSSWIEYDTYGHAEPYNHQRPSEWWPNYLHKTNLDDPGGPPPATNHSRVLPNLTPGALYHYSIVTHPGRTADATFVAGAQGPTPTRTAPPTPTPASYTISVNPGSVAPGAPVTVTLHDGAPAAWHVWGRVNQTTTEWGFLDCTHTGPNPPGITDATCTLPAPSTPGTYTYILMDAGADPQPRPTLATSNVLIVSAPAPTRTATLVATRTPTATAPPTALPTSTPLPTATPVQCYQVRIVGGGEIVEPCP